jgi:hypothetical protein
VRTSAADDGEYRTTVARQTIDATHISANATRVAEEDHGPATGRTSLPGTQSCGARRERFA